MGFLRKHNGLAKEGRLSKTKGILATHAQVLEEGGHHCGESNLGAGETGWSFSDWIESDRNGLIEGGVAGGREGRKGKERKRGGLRWTFSWIERGSDSLRAFISSMEAWTLSPTSFAMLREK